MDNLTAEKLQDDGCSSEIGNKRKRRLSSQYSDESPKKKIPTTTSLIHTSVVVKPNNEKGAYISGEVGVDKAAADDHGSQQSDNEKEIQSQFFLEELCDEVLYEIFKFLDTWTLMALMTVCKRLQTFVLDKRLWENIDLSQEPLPLGILEDMLERSHDKTKSIKLKGPSPSQHLEGEIKHFNKTIQNSFTTRCTKLVTLELYGVTLDFTQITFKDFPQTLKRLVLSNCNVRTVKNKSLFTGIDTMLVNLEELAIESNSWFDPYYIMPLSKLPLLRYFSVRGCCKMQEFIPYGSIASRHGFKQLEVLDLRETPLSDSDLQCFNVIANLKEMYLQCPEDHDSIKPESCTDEINKSKESEIDMPTTSFASATNTNRSLDPQTPSSTQAELSLNELKKNRESEIDLATASNSLETNTTRSLDIETSSSAQIEKCLDELNKSNESDNSQAIISNVLEPNVNRSLGFETASSALTETCSNESNNKESYTVKPTTSNATTVNSMLNVETPFSTANLFMGANQNDHKGEKTDDSLKTPTLSFNDSESTSSSPSSSSSSPSTSSLLPKSNSIGDSNAADSPSTSGSPGLGLSPNIVPLVGTNAPSRSRFLPRPDHIFYLDVRNRTSPNVVHFNRRDHMNLRHLLFAGQPQQQEEQQNQQNQQNEQNQQNQRQQSPPPVNEQIMHHNIFWDIVNPLGRVVGVGGPDRLFGEENGAQYNFNLLSLLLSDRQQPRGTISDRGVCCFGRTRQPSQHGVIWIRFNNRPTENRFERFSVRDYKSVTDISMQHLAQCSPFLIFLDVSGTGVTLQGLQRFKEMKPECTVVAEHLLDVAQSESTVV